MKKHISVLLLASASLLGACKDFMDRQPLSDISPDQFFNSETELSVYTKSFYSVLPSAEGIYNEGWDNIAKNSTPDDVSGKRTVPQSGGGWTWTELRKINYFLANYNKKVPESVAAKHAAAARFFRAYFYFDKVQRFGDVPWYSGVIAETDTAMLKKPRDPRALVMDSVLKDIDYAIANLPTAAASDKVTKWTALLLKSRIGLYEGTFRKYHNLPDGQKFLEAAVSASEELMKGPYKIYTSTPDKAYMELFASVAPNKDEVILARTFSNDLQVWHNVNYYTITASYGKPGLEKQLVNSYLMKDGSRFTDKLRYDTLSFYSETQNRDPRLAQTIRTPGYTRIGSTTIEPPSFGASVSGYQLVKFVTDKTTDSYNRSINAMPIFRYAEGLLNYAEAKAELGTLTQADINKSIKLLRDRVGMPNLDVAAANATPDPYIAAQYPNVAGANKGVILEIRRERRIELVMESYRWDDLMRWKAGQQLTRTFKGMYFTGLGSYDLDRDGKIDVIIYEGSTKPTGAPQVLKLGSEIVLENGKNGGPVVINANITKSFDEEKDYLWPIPIQERLLNRNLSQNPKWNDGL
ncbi:RagB/SusD family nutrient uptake outer membrane protein [Chitinophaga lutea]